MGLSLIVIGFFIIFAIIYALLIPAQLRQWSLFIASIILIYVLQPDIFVRWLDFFLPTLTLLLVTLTWHFTCAEKQKVSRNDWVSLIIIVTLVIGLSLLRYLDIDWRWFLPSRPPPIQLILGVISLIGLIAIFMRQWSGRLSLLLVLFIALFAILKTEPLAIWLSQNLRGFTNQDRSLAAAIDLNWLGFSYVAFRLIHTIRDRQSGLLPTLSLHEYVTYVIFFPSFIAGPIDRAERFIDDFRKLSDEVKFSDRYIHGFTRIMIGITKKFIIADTLAQGIALNPINALQVDNALGAWLLLYAYALRLFFDFSGYSDIAIGIGILLGINLPENFSQPYTRTSITKFWQSWHITLSNWVRFYVFSPLTRYLLKRKPKPSAILIVLITQLTTMIVIGIWHGVTVNFLVWGIWHGLGLFIHKQWSDRTRKFYRELKQKSRTYQMIADGLAWIVTFHFVVLGWVWFALPTFEQAVNLFIVLFGFV